MLKHKELLFTPLQQITTEQLRERKTIYNPSIFPKHGSKKPPSSDGANVIAGTTALTTAHYGPNNAGASKPLKKARATLCPSNPLIFSNILSARTMFSMTQNRTKTTNCFIISHQKIAVRLSD